MDSRHEDALRRIRQADKAWSDDGHEPELFRLHHRGGMESHIDHPRWDRAWAVPSEHTIDDLEEMGYLRVEPHFDKRRSFVLTPDGRRKAEEPTGGSSYTDAERQEYAKKADAELALAIETFFGQVGNETFTADDLAAAVPMPKFEITAAVHWLRLAHAEGKVSPAGGGWRVNVDGSGPTFHVRVVPAKARDQLSGPIYALDLTEAEVLEKFVAPYQERLALSWDDRTLSSYRKPKIGRLYESGAETVARIRESLKHSTMVHVPNQAEELFFDKTVQDVTEQYIGPDEPLKVDPELAPTGRLARPGGKKKIFLVHGHSRKDELARFLERSTGVDVTILEEQPGRGRTIIEKFEGEAGGAAFAVVLLTADDVGAAMDEQANLRPRARQNVVLELGYFVGRIGRENVVALHDPEVELPSDYTGVEYVPLDGDWKHKLMTELGAAGFDVKHPGS
ncbi:MAG TPA: nucleotide-binding protein [Solirubrobacterales bacterium]|jgi:predicted nucleotide-binding protein|nr:nucleotide-binding protein [Solirubrobacterales bacterium]